MTRYAILLGDAPEDFRQTKIEDMFDFLSSKDEAKRGGVVTFPNGISEMMLELVLDNSFKQLTANTRHCERSEAILKNKNTEEDCFVAIAPRNDVGISARDSHNGGAQNSNQILLYICAQSPVKDSDKSLWLGGEEIRRGVIEHYKTLAAETGIDLQVVLDWCKDFASEEELGYEEAVPAGPANFINGDER